MNYLIAILLGMSLTACCPSCFLPKKPAATANEAAESGEEASDQATLDDSELGDLDDLAEESED